MKLKDNLDGLDDTNELLEKMKIDGLTGTTSLLKQTILTFLC